MLGSGNSAVTAKLFDILEPSAPDSPSRFPTEKILNFVGGGGGGGGIKREPFHAF